MCGAPGCGKSTYAKEYCKKYPETVYVSRDEIRFSLLAEDEYYFSHETEVLEKFYTNIANAIRTKNGTNNSYTPANMPNAILNLGGNWLGENPEYIKQVYALNTTLDQTGFASWTPSSTATSIKASETLSTKETLDLEHYDYVIKWVSDCNVAYNDTWTPIKATCLREITLYAQTIFQRPSSVSTVEDETFNYTAVQQGAYQIYWCKYYKRKKRCK